MDKFDFKIGEVLKNHCDTYLFKVLSINEENDTYTLSLPFDEPEDKRQNSEGDTLTREEAEDRYDLFKDDTMIMVSRNTAKKIIANFYNKTEDKIIFSD